jgi:hypothetical protein
MGSSSKCNHTVSDRLDPVRFDGVCPICLQIENDALWKLLREDRSKWGFDALVFVGRRLLDEVYPACVFDGSSGDSGPQLIVALRAALDRIDAQKPKVE